MGRSHAAASRRGGRHPMLKARKLRNLGEAIRANELYRRGDEAWSKGSLRPAFRFFLAAARAGMVAAFSTVGQFYERGDGARVNKNAALYWYRRAAREGYDSAANNIGCILRDRGRLGEALRWFKQAVKLGDADANLEIAKIHFRRGDTPRAWPYLKKTIRSPWATEQSKEQARLLLKELKTGKAKRISPRARSKSAPSRVHG